MIAVYEEEERRCSEEKGKVEEKKEEKKVEKKEGRNPPITISREDAMVAREVLTKNGVDFEIKTFRKDAMVETSGSKTYKDTIEILRKNNVKAHWPLRKDDRPLRSVIKFIPAEVELDEVRKELEGEGIKVESLARMGSKKAPLDMVAVNTDRSEESRKIYSCKSVGNFRVRVETRRKPVHQRQCYRCLGFGHVQYRCTRREACAFCAGEHQSRDCTKTKGEGVVASCFNCGGPHPAFFRTCPRNPEMMEKKREEDRQKRVLESEVRVGVFYADRLKKAEKKEVRVEQAPRSSNTVSLEDRIEAMIRKLVPEIVKALNE